MEENEDQDQEEGGDNLGNEASETEGIGEERVNGGQACEDKAPKAASAQAEIQADNTSLFGMFGGPKGPRG